MRTTLDFQGKTVAVTFGEGERWDVEVAGKHHHARYLDVVLEQAFPNAGQSERNLLQVKVLESLDDALADLARSAGEKGLSNDWPHRT
jgi:hypothetical protein